MKLSHILSAWWAFIGCVPTVYTHGVPNLVQVEPGFYRSGQITTAEGWQYMRSLGVTDSIKLNFDSEGTDDGALAVGIVVHKFSIQPEGDKDVFDNLLNTFVKPDRNLLNQALQTTHDIKQAGGVPLVHCTHGHDRTGEFVGMWRVEDDNWTVDEAYDEMIRLGYHKSLIGLDLVWNEFAKEHEQD